jgi:uncharacterized membrane protein
LIYRLLVIIYVSETATSVKSVITAHQPVLCYYVCEFKIFQKTFRTGNATNSAVWATSVLPAADFTRINQLVLLPPMVWWQG